MAKDKVKIETETAKKQAVITGACGGLACATIKWLQTTNEWSIFGLDVTDAVATLFDGENYKGIVCDITKEESVKTAFQVIESYTESVELVVNFAGIVVMGSLIETDVKLIQKIVDVNIVGMQIVNKYAFPLLNNAKASRIINMSSECGYLSAVPFNAPYGFTKHAVEIYNDALRRELLKTNIKVIKISPGAYKTNMQSSITAKFEEILNGTRLYKATYQKMQGMMLAELKTAKDPERFVKVIKKAIYSKHPRLRYKNNNSFTMGLLSILPEKLQDMIYKAYFRE